MCRSDSNSICAKNAKFHVRKSMAKSGFGTMSQFGMIDRRDKTERDVRTALCMLALMECAEEN